MKPQPILIDDAAFFIANVMRDCPATTVIRELLQNAIEAANGGRIEWCRFDWYGVSKICLYNEGPGMSEEQLRSRMNIASSSKRMGFRNNFGQGAKMSGGKASPHGLVYRSCVDRLVFQIWLQVQDRPNGGKSLVIQPQYDEVQEEDALVCQVTDDAVARGRSLDHEWTEAILLGRGDGDDTTTSAFLYPGKPSLLWLMQSINQRYYRFPKGVVVHNATITTDRAKHRIARGMFASLVGNSATEREDVVAADHPNLGPLEIRYGKLSGDPRGRKGGSLAADGLPGGSHVCLVYKDEIYDFDPKWYFRAGAYGFSGACEDYYVHILIPDDAAVRNNNHRTELVCDDSNAETIECEKLCDIVRSHRPQWVLDDLASRNKIDGSSKVQDRLRSLALKMQARMDTPTILPGLGNDPGVIELDKGSGQGGEGRPSHREPTEHGRSVIRGLGKRQDRPRPDTLSAQFRDKEAWPGWYEELEGYAGCYDKGDNTIWLSKDFSEFRRLKAWADQCWPSSDENAKASEILYEEYCYYAGTFGVAGLSFRGNANWNPDDWERCLSQEAISAQMRDPDGMIEKNVKQKVHRLLNLGTRNQAMENPHGG